MRDRSIIATAGAVLVALAIAGCGSASSPGNGVAAKTPNQIVTASTKAIDGVRSVQVSGSITDGAAAKQVTLDLHLVAGRGATGTVAQDGLSFRLVTVDNETYLNGTPAFWRQYGGAAVERVLQGKWLRAPANSGDLASFSSLTDLSKLISRLLSSHGALVKGPRTTLRGERVIALRDTSKHGTLYVATSGAPYPLRITNTGTGAGRLDFSDFNGPVTLTAPASSISVSSLHR